MAFYTWCMLLMNSSVDSRTTDPNRNYHKFDVFCRLSLQVHCTVCELLLMLDTTYYILLNTLHNGSYFLSPCYSVG